jgi:hypothetical protein
MGTWRAYLAFRAPADLGTPLMGAEAQPWTTPGWTFLEGHISSASSFEERVGALAGPALFAVVCDSDFAQVVGYTDGVRQWEVFINHQRAASYDAPVPSIPAADDQALLECVETWGATTATASMDRAKLRRVLSANFVFADDGLIALTQLLGIVSADVQPFGNLETIELTGRGMGGHLRRARAVSAAAAVRGERGRFQDGTGL